MGRVFTTGAATGSATARKFGTHELVFTTRSAFANPYWDVELKLTFTRPDGSSIQADGFYDGGNFFKTRAYCDMEGVWQWSSSSNHPDLQELTGSFTVMPSTLPGKLRIHPQDPHQFAYDNGHWFLHIGDTGYRYAIDTEPNWKEYLHQAAAAGFTKIRISMAQGRSDVAALYQADRQRLNLSFWQEIDRRLIYALNHYPELMLQLIPFFEDAEEVKRYGEGDPAARLAIRITQARYSSFANIHYCFTNDLVLTGGNDHLEREGQDAADKSQLHQAIDQIGRDMKQREPWGTLLTNHQSRFSGYSYLEAGWSDIITLEDMGQVEGRLILEYRGKKNQPAVLDEDRYECWRSPKHDRYFFRRLMWVSLLSGGHATYGGLKTYEQYDCGLSGMYGYYDACREGKLANGADDFIHIHRFFHDSGLSLVRMVPDDDAAGGAPLLYKLTKSADKKQYIVYLANPDQHEGHSPDGFGGLYTDESAAPSTRTPQVQLTIPEAVYRIQWFNPSTGQWFHGGDTEGGTCSITAPGSGDWVVLLSG